MVFQQASQATRPFLCLPSPKPHKSPSPLPAPKTNTREDKFLQVFCFFDSNNDGKISTEELRAYFFSIGDTMSYDDVQRVISEFDLNGDNLLEFKEFVKLMERDDNHERDVDDDEDLRQAFETFEIEKGCGCITPKGLRLVLKRLGLGLGLGGDEKSDDECEAMIGVFDLDGNGVLDFHEFQKMMT